MPTARPIRLSALCLVAAAAVLETAPLRGEVQRQVLPHPADRERSVELIWREPAGPPPWPAILFVHGHQFPERPGAYAYVERGTLEEFVVLGYLAAAVSQPGYGGSDGPPDFCGPASQQAVHAALAAIRQRPDVDPGRIVLSGGSRGAIVASMVASREPELAGLVLRGGIYDLEDAYRRMEDDFGGKQNLEREAGTSERAFRERSAIFAPDDILVPTLIFHGEDDPISPVDHVHRLAARLEEAGTPVTVKVFPGVGHRVPWELRREPLNEFLSRAVGAPAPPMEASPEKAGNEEDDEAEAPSSAGPLAFLASFVGDWGLDPEGEAARQNPELASGVAFRFEWAEPEQRILRFYEGIPNGDLDRRILESFVTVNPRSGEVVALGYQRANDYLYEMSFEPLDELPLEGFVRLYRVTYPPEQQFRRDEDRERGWIRYRDRCRLVALDRLHCVTEQLRDGEWEAWGSPDGYTLVRR